MYMKSRASPRRLQTEQGKIDAKACTKYNARGSAVHKLFTEPLLRIFRARVGRYELLRSVNLADAELEADCYAQGDQTHRSQIAVKKKRAERLAKISQAVRTIIECVGEDPSREGLLATPDRYAKAMLYFTQGYEENLSAIIHGAVFDEDYEGMVIVKEIEFFSLCEHHFVPFSGKVCFRRGSRGHCRLTMLDAPRIRPQLQGHRALKDRQNSRDVFAAAPDSGKAQEASRACFVRSTPAARRCSCCGIQSVLHGHAWSSEDAGYHHDHFMLGCLKQSVEMREEFLTLINRS